MRRDEGRQPVSLALRHVGGVLEVCTRSTERGLTIEAAGEIDHTTVSVLRDPLLGAVRDMAGDSTPLRLDLRRVAFIDSAGLALIVSILKDLAQTGRSLLVIVSRGEQPDRALRMCRLDAILPLDYVDSM